MKVRCAMLGGEVVTATLVARPSMTSRSGTEVVLELEAGAPLQVDPPDGFGCEVVEATAAEWAALEQAGYALAKATS